MQGKLLRPDRAAELGYTKCQFCLAPFIERQTVYVAEVMLNHCRFGGRLLFATVERMYFLCGRESLGDRAATGARGKPGGVFSLSRITRVCLSIGTIAFDTRGRSRRTANKSKKRFSDGSRRWIAGHSAKVRGGSIQGGHLFFSRAENQLCI
jgi:hypothetical protein